MTLREVRAILGAPSRVQLREEYGFGNHFTWYVWRSGWEVSVRGHRDRARVLRVATSLRRERTPGGFGVGSSDRELKRRLGARCLDYDGQPDESGRVWAPSIGKDHIFCVLGGRGWHGYHTVFTAEETCPGFVLAPHQKCPMKRRVYRVFEVAVQQPQR